MAPDEALRRWPAGQPLSAIWGDGLTPWSDWIILAKPTGEISNKLPERPRGAGSELPFAGGWIGVIDYEHGAELEPRAGGAPAPGPTIRMVRCESGLACHVPSGRWWRFGTSIDLGSADPGGFRVGPLRSETGRKRFERMVARGVEYIHAGDVFQVNLTHRLSAAFEGSPRSLFAALSRSGMRHGAYVELPERTVVSASPELLFDFDARARRLVTRPMKGTRPGECDPAELIGSAKDRAELNMIVDLMRNDLGRVCDFGTVSVTAPREIERHGGEPGVLQSVATVEGRVREGLGPAEIVRALFPGGSITGAPKIRAMQIIDELEQRGRGAYCGAIGFVSDSGHARFNVGIRTATITGDRLDFDVGAGVVAESDPALEWEETMVKAGVIRNLASAP